MHVCMLTDYFLPHVLGGTEKVVYELGKRLVRKGCHITVVTLNTEGVEEHCQIEGINVYRLPALSATELIGAQLTLSPLALFKVQRILKRTRPDIIHAHNLYFQLTMVVPIIKHLLHIPLVTTLHLPKMIYGRITLDALISLYQKVIGTLIIRSSDKLVAVSQSVMDHALTDLHVHPSKIALVPNGVDTDLYSPPDEPPSDPIVTYVGRLIRNKGAQCLIEAGAYILKDHPRTHIYLIGDGPLKEKLSQQVTSRKLQSHIHILGSVPDIVPTLQRTTVFVRPSLTGEAISLAILEAMACGVPVIASGVDGNREIVKSGVNGYLVQPGNSRALAQAIMSLLANPDLAAKMGKNARKTAERHYSWTKTSEQMLKIYSSMT